MRCEKTGCTHEATANVSYIGGVRWTANLCQTCLDEFWSESRGLCGAGVADVIFTPIEERSV